MATTEERRPLRGPCGRRLSAMMAHGLVAALVVALLATLVAASPLAAQTANQAAGEERLTERLLAGDLERHRTARQRETAAGRRLTAALAALDQALAPDARTPLERFEELEAEADAARAAWSVAAERSRDLRAAIYVHRRRLAAAADELARRRGTPELPDPISGAWRLVLEPGDVHGLLDLELDGTVLGGRLGLDDGSVGSVRGTFVDGALRVERVSAEGGLDLVFEGRFDPGSGELAGSWRRVILGRGEPAAGTWEAEKGLGD